MFKINKKNHVESDYINGFFRNFYHLIKYRILDLKRDISDKKQGIIHFKPFGLRVYTGRQGSGKTIGLVEALARARDSYPDCIIVTNFDCKYAHKRLTSLNDLLKLRNGTKGIIFGIDEMQNEFSSKVSKDFPENLLEMITQQRKQRIAIFTTSQVFSRLAKPLREQSYEVCTCRTYLGRLTRIRCYDALDYMEYMESDSDDKRRKAPKNYSHWFVQTDALRNAYDTYSVIERLSRKGFTQKVWYESN